jgi:hypothetical protein
MDKSICKKLRGYKAQDEKNKIFSSFHFIKPEELQLTDAICYYCKQTVLLEYKCRDPLQWTLDRIDNTMGHNKKNVLISCLGCNLKRRNRTVEKFLFTKQLTITKLT